MKIYRYVLLLSCLGTLLGQDAEACSLPRSKCGGYVGSCLQNDIKFHLSTTCPLDFSVLAKEDSGRKKLFQRWQNRQDQIIKQIPILKQAIQSKEQVIQEKLQKPNPNANELRKLMREKLGLESQLQSISSPFFEINKEINRLPDNEIKILWQQQQHCLKQLKPTPASPDRELCVVK